MARLVDRIKPADPLLRAPGGPYDPESLLARFPELTADILASEGAYFVEAGGIDHGARHTSLDAAIAAARQQLDDNLTRLLRKGALIVVDGLARPAPTRDPRERVGELLAAGNRHVMARRERDDLIRNLLADAGAALSPATRDQAQALGFQTAPAPTHQEG